MKILLAYQSGLTNRNDPYISLLPTGLAYMHACLKEAGYNSLLANFSAWSSAQIEEVLNDFKPDFIGISQWTHNRHNSLELAQLCRNHLPHSLIVMGGAHATFCYKDILYNDSPVDIVVLGEAEATLLETVALHQTPSEWQKISGIAYKSNDQIVVTLPRENIEKIDLLPLPSKYLEQSVGVDIQLQSEFIVTTRGCPSTCYFCSSPDFWGRKVRFRSPVTIVDEILFIRKKYGLIYFSIRDDTFTADRKRVLEFCKLLKERNANILWNCQSRVTAIDEELLIAMKQAGCECIQLGVESGSPRILNMLGKKITPAQTIRACSMVREIGINLSVYLISDTPDETTNDINMTIELVRKINAQDGYVSPLAYYPGTKLYSDAVAAGTIKPSLFKEKSDGALYASSAKGKSAPRILNELIRNRQNDSNCFKQQKARIGECYTTNVIAGELYRQNGAFLKAEKEFKAITTLMPDNPWGWFLLGDLYTEEGKIERGRDCYNRVLEIVPEHEPSKVALER